MPSIGDIWVTIGGDASDLESAVSKAQSSLSGLSQVSGKTLKETGRNFQSAGDAINKVTKPIQVASAALAAGAVASAKFAVDFEDNFAAVTKTVDGTDEQLAQIKQDIIDLTTTGLNGNSAIPQTTAELTELAAAGGQLGIETENITAFTETMAQLGTATNLSGEEGAQVLARFMNVTGTSQEYVSNLGSAIVDLGNNFATTESEIANMALNLGATATTVGISAQDVLAYSTALSSLGVEAEAGGSAVSRILMSIQQAVSAGGEDLEMFATTAGKSAEEFAQQWGEDASGAFQDFLKGINESDDVIGALQDLGFSNIRDLQALQRLAGPEGFELLTEAIERANSAWSENTALQTEFNAKAETTASQMQIAKNNLVEAGRSIGESFLPYIVDGTAKITEFAQSIANMSDDSKDKLISVGTAVVALGAGAKALSSGAKIIGSVTEGIGTISELAASGTVLASVASSLSAALPLIGGAAAAIAVPFAVYGGIELYAKHVHEAYEELLKCGEGAEEIAENAVAAEDAADKTQEYADRLRDVNDIINKGSDGTSEGDTALNNALAERKELIQWFIDNYGEYVSAMSDGNDVSQETADAIAAQTAAERAAKIAEYDATIAEGGANIPQLQSTISTLKDSTQAAYENNTALYECKAALTEYKAAQDALDKSYESGQISKKEYANSLDELDEKYIEAAEAYESLTKDNWNYGNANMTEDALAAIDERITTNNENVEQFKQDIETATGSIESYQAAARTMNDYLVSAIPDALAAGDGSVEEYIAKIGEYGNTVGLSFDEMGAYANRAALGLNGLTSTAEAVEQGEDAVNNTTRDVISTMESWGYSAQEAAVQGALFKNGFNDLSSALASDSGLETVSQQANELAQSFGELPEGKKIEITASGDIEVIDEATERIEEIDGQNVSVKVTADGDLSTITDAGEEIHDLDGQAASVTVNAEGNYSVLDTLDNVIASIDGTTGTVTITAQDTATKDAQSAETAVEDIPEDHNTDINATDNATDTINAVAKAVNALPDSKTITINTVTTETKHEATGTQNFGGGLAMINDQKGISDPRELVEYDGKGYLFEGRDVIVPLPKHAKVYTAAQTKEMLGRNIPHFASGTSDAWNEAVSAREHIRAVTYRTIDPREELEWLEEMTEQFASDAEALKEIEEEVVSYTREMWESDLQNLEYCLDMGWISQSEYYQRLAEYRDANFAPDTEEYKDATLELHEYSATLIDDANDISEAYVSLHGELNDWDEMGTSMSDVWHTINSRNVQAAKDGLITWEEYFQNREDLTEQFIDGYIDYSEDWISHEQKYNGMSADDTIAAIKRQQAAADEFFSSLGELTDEEYAVKVSIDASLSDSLYDAISSAVEEWEDDADFYKKQADVYGWDFFGDSESSYYARVRDKYLEYYNNEELSYTERLECLRKADEAALDYYSAVESEYDDALDEAQSLIDETEELLNEKLSALDEEWEVEDRAAARSDALSDIEKYANAVTVEGRQKYQDALEELQEIEREEQRYQMELENNAILEALQEDYDALEAEKADVLSKIRDTSLDTSTYLSAIDVSGGIETLTSSINSNMTELKTAIENAIKDIQPSIVQNNTNYISDSTDAVLFSNTAFNRLLSTIGG